MPSRLRERRVETEPRAYAVSQHLVRQIAVVTGMRGISEDGGRQTDARPAVLKDLAVAELLSGQVDFDPRRQTVPHVRHDPPAVEQHVRRHELAPDQIIDDERSHVALTTPRVTGGPSTVRLDGIGAPALPDCLFELGERVHASDNNPTS